MRDLLSARQADAGVAKGDRMSTSSSFLPARPSLEQLRKRAKELLRDVRDAEPSALARFRVHLSASGGATLADAQFVIAREHGFASWTKLKRHVLAIERPGDFDEAIWGRDSWPFLVAVFEGRE